MTDEYLVKWEIELDAESPEEAAKLARKYQLDPNSTATYFEVTNTLWGGGESGGDMYTVPPQPSKSGTYTDGLGYTGAVYTIVLGLIIAGIIWCVGALLWAPTLT